MRKSNQDVVVTGLGAVCRLGDDLDSITALLRRGESPPFKVWPAAVEAGCACHLAGIYDGDLSDDVLGVSRPEGRFLGRSARLAIRAARSAIRQAEVTPSGLAVVVGSGTGDVDTHIEIEQTLGTSSARRVRPTVIPRVMASTVSANLVNVLRSTGPSLSVTAACAGGAWNIVVGAQLVASGAASAALVGGSEAWDPHFHAGFDTMRAYNRVDNEAPHRASRPYAADRAGFIFGEGAGLLVLERREAAEARGAEILATLLGWGASSDGQGQMVAPSSEGAVRAMRACLQTVGVEPALVDYVNTHATSTPVGDVSEVRALREVFGSVRYSSTKGYTGHTISAAGALEAIFTIQMLRHRFLAPSVFAEPMDPEVADMPPVVQPTESTITIALSNSFGFGGTNACVAFGL